MAALFGMAAGQAVADEPAAPPATDPTGRPAPDPNGGSDPTGDPGYTEPRPPEPAYDPVAGNPADKLLDVPLEDYRYDYARKCRKRPMPGMVALEAWLGKNTRGESWGIMRCEKLSKKNWSLHSEGRALDWRLNVHDRSERKAADKLINLLLAPDSAGNPHALARRMGIQEIIWNCQAWWSGSDAMAPYSVCFDKRGKRRRVDDTTAHRNHVHIGLNLPGARRQTSFWR